MKTSLLKKEESLLLFEPLLNHFQLKISNDEDFVKNLKSLCKEISYLSNLDRVGIWFFDSSKCNLYCHCLFNKNNGQYEKQSPIALSLFPEYWTIIRNSKVICSTNPREDIRFSEFSERYLQSKNIKSIINASIWAFGDVVGVISGSRTLSEYKFTEEDKEIYSLSSEITSQWFYQLSKNQGSLEKINLPPYKTYLKSLLRICSETFYASPLESIQSIVEVTRQSLQAKAINSFVFLNEELKSFSSHVSQLTDVTSEDVLSIYKLISKTNYLWLPKQDAKIKGVPDYVHKLIIDKDSHHLIIPYESTHRKKTPYLGILVIHFDDDLTFKHEILDRCQYAIESIKTVLNHIHTQSLYRESIEISRAAFDNSTVGMILLNKNADVIRYNQAANKIFNFANKKRINILSFFPEKEIRNEMLCNNDKDPVSFQTETIINTKNVNSKKVILNFSPISLDNNLGRYSLLQIIDISEKEKALKDLADQKVFFKSVIDASPNFIFAKDIQGRFILANKAVADAYGTTEEKLIGLTDSDFNTDKTQVDKFLSDDSFVITSGKELCIYDEEVTDSTGSIRYLYTVKKPLYSEEHKEQIVLGVSTDITTRKKAEEEYKVWLSNLEHSQKLESLGLLASGIAHDFNNILQGVIGNASLSLELLDSNSKAKELTESILFSALKAAEITNQLLNYTGKGSFEPTLIDVRDVVAETFKMIDRIVNKKANIRFKNCMAPLPILADKPKMNQVILNLLTNAVESLTSSKGTVFISTSCIDAGLAEIKYDIPHSTCKAYALIQITDNGIGISKENVKRIFEPFFTTKVAGRGIGLSAVQGIVKSHGGYLKVESEINIGTTFTVLIPLTEQQTVVLDHTSLDSCVTSSIVDKKCILVIDDEAITREVCVSMLSYINFSVVQAHDGIDGIDKFIRHKDKLAGIILDLTMPKMDGIEVYQKIREMHDEIPILFSSGYSEHQISFNLKNLHNTSFIQKPYTIHDFKKTILEAVKSKNEINNFKKK